MSRPTIFLSYCKQDTEWKDRLQTHLKVFKDRFYVWSDECIRAGSDRFAEIEAAISRADVAVLLISAEYLASDSLVAEEVPWLLERREHDGLLIVPVIVKPCAWDQLEWLNRMQVRPAGGQTLTGLIGFEIDAALTQIVYEITRLLEESALSQPCEQGAGGSLPENQGSHGDYPIWLSWVRACTGVLSKLMPELIQVLANEEIPEEKLVRIYHDCVPDDYLVPAHGSSADLLPEMVRLLAETLRDSRTGTFPLLRFIKLLAEEIPHRAEELQAWIDKALEYLAANADDLGQQRAVLDSAKYEHPATGPVYLQVQIETVFGSPGSYSIKAYLVESDGHGESLLAGQQCSRDQIPALVDKLRSEVIARKRIPREQIWVELMLPRELLCSDADCWNVALSLSGKKRIGLLHRVVVRSLERAMFEESRQALTSHWDESSIDCPVTCWDTESPPRRDDGERVGLMIGKETRGGEELLVCLEDKRVACALLCQPPAPEEPEDKGADVLCNALDAGLGILCWVRESFVDTEAAVKTLRELVEGSCLKHLPDKIWDQRRQAAGQPDHVGYHLTLIWDDPTRPFPDFEEMSWYTTPQQRR